MFIEPTYQFFKATKENDINLTLTIITKQKAIVDYKSIEIPIGIRHYLFLNDESKIFINATYILNYALNSTIKFEVGQDLEIKPKNYYAIGMGYEFNNSLNIEFRKGFDQNILSQYAFWNSN
ncbi:MAG: hypothetical protein L3J20_13195 [Flavobacteriaceae bacterium]|nr:hypothetical protein [Flavobacteriaceae bacterium]